MSRSRTSARKAGARFEREVADFLATALGDPSIDRRVKTGARDRGDVANVRANGLRAVVECKDVARTDLAGWLGEAEAERANDGADVGVVIHKRRGVSDPGEQYVTMTLRTFAAMAIGEMR